MRRIEYFCRNIRHHDAIEEQMEEAQEGGIIKSFTLTTISAMNARRNANICLWCDEIWSADHTQSCMYVPDHNCMFTCGEDYEVFAFVKVTKEGLKPIKVQHFVEEELRTNADNMFGELCVSNSSNSCILPERKVLSRVDQVFDEIPLPNTTLNQAQMVRDDLLRETNSSISSREAIICSAPQVFDELSQPVLSSNSGQITEGNQDNNALMSHFDNNTEIQVYDECTHGHENEETQIDGIRSSQVQHYVDEVYEFRGEPDNTFVKEIQQPDAHNMLDELPIPTFIKEMAEAAKIAKLDSVQGASDTIYGDSNDYLAYKQIFAKLGTLDGPYFRDLVIIGASLGRFSSLQRSLSQVCYPLDQMSQHCSGTYAEELYSRCPSTQVSMNFVKNVISPLFYSDIDWFMGSNLSMILGVEAYDAKVFVLKHDSRTFLNFKGSHGSSIYQACWNSRLLRLNEEYVWKWHQCIKLLINSLDCTCTVCHKKMVPQMKVFDPGLAIIEIITLRLHVSDIFVVISFKSTGIASLSGQIRGDSTLNSINLHDGIIHDTEVIFLVMTCGTAILKMVAFPLSAFNLLGGAFRLKLTACAFTLEDKGDFEEVGNGNVLALHWTIQHAEDHLTINYDTVTFTTITSFGFDPGGVKYEHYPNMGSVLDMIVWVFDPRESGNSSRSTSVLSSSDLVYKIGINRNRMLYLMFFYHENDIFQSGDGGYVRRVNYWVHHGFATINSKKTSKSLPNHVLVGHMKQLLALGHYLVCTHCHSPLDYSDMLFGYGIENQNATILIFDPGGFKCWPKMRNRLEAYWYNGCNYEDTQIYVFDPGGPLMWLAMDAMVTNPKPGLGMCYVMSCLKYHLSLILEDKDRFKRRVLIHTEI